VAEKIRNFIEYETVVVDENKKIRLTVSLGVVAVAPGKLKEIEDYNVIIKLADSALYQAKKRVETGQKLRLKNDSIIIRKLANRCGMRSSRRN
jgi:diguanylate cyclase (GGDEF)-like protein